MEMIGRLRTIPIFGALNLALLSYLADACQIEHYPAGTLIYSAEQPADTFFVVDQGQIVLTGDDYPTTLVGNGMAFGFLARPPSSEHRHHLWARRPHHGRVHGLYPLPHRPGCR